MKKTTWTIVFLLILSVSNIYSQNRLVNGDFENGGNGVGFSINSSQYLQLSPPFSGNTSPGNYAVTDNPKLLNTANFIAGGDHTSGSGKMLVVDATTSGGQQRFWRAGDNGGGACGLAVGTVYTFSYWIKSVSTLVTGPSTQADIKIIFNNASNITLVSGNTLAPLPASGWQQVIYTFTPTNQCVNIEIYDNNLSAIGNDFAVDDFSLTAPPAPLTISSSKLNPTCPGVSDATIVAYPNGGVSPYIFSLTGTATATNTSGIFQGLAEGTYNVTVRDSNNPPSEAITSSISIVSPLDLTLTSSSTGCNFAGSPITLTAFNGGTSYSWTASTGIQISESDDSVLVNPQQTTTYTVTSTTSSLTKPNLIENGDFESGTSGFFSDYGYSTSNTSGAQFAYGVVSNPKNWFVDFVNSTDHSGSGKMLVADGATNPNKVIWSQSLPVENNKQYTFSFWAQNLVASNPAKFQVLINGTPITIAPISATNGSTSGWTEITGTWDSTNATIATIKIIDTNIASSGNDFALDDISFSTPTPKTCNLSTQLTITIGGVTPITNFSYPTPVCKNGINPIPSPALGFTNGGVYSELTGLLSIDSVTGEINLAASPSGTYTVKYLVAENSEICQAEGFSTFEINISPTLSSPEVLTAVNYCINAPATALTATASVGATLNWYGKDQTGGEASSVPTIPSTSLVGSTTYYVSQSIGVCESARVPITVTINDVSTPIFVGIPQSVCSDSALQNLPSVSSNNIAGTWNPAVINTTVTTTYVFTPNLGQCSTTTSVTIDVNSTIVPTFNSVEPICSGELLLPLPTTSTNNIIGIWSPDIDNTITKIYTFTPNIGQCATIQTITISVNSIPDISVSGGCEGESFVLSVNQNSSDNLVYSWFNSSKEEIGSTPSIRINKVGNYEVEVADGVCKVSKNIEVNSIYCDIPKGISPNGDTKNDSFDLTNFSVNKLEIFNRYGIKVYTKSGYKNEWDGTSDKGQELPDGTYYYVVEFESGKSKTGWVYLNREH